MDYEKKYKEALERMKSWARGEHPECFSEAQKAAEFVFPELRESDDERIRRGLIDFLWKEKIFLQEVSSHVENNPKYRFVMDAIAWLEKHTYTQRDVDDAYLKGINDTKNILENRGKLTNFSQNVPLTEFEEALADVCRGWIGKEIGWKDYIIRNANALLKICQKMWNEVQDAPFEKNPTWSEEDEENLNRVIGVIERREMTSTVEQYKDILHTYICWLQSLKDRVQSQPRQWSEEDEKMLDFCIKHYADGNCITWLESLRTRLGGSEHDNVTSKTTNVGNSSITVEGMYNPTKDASV